MKPIKLEIEGLNSFETKQILDFSALGDGVFGIFGKTGSGKSTILDAITLALYGKVERSKQNIDFINTKSKKAVVSFEFEIFSGGSEKVFYVTRTFQIRKNGKDVESSAELFEVFGENKNMIEEGVTKVDAKIFSIIGLGVNEFSKCIALPQGEFSAFLKAKPLERTEIMSNIFNLSKYGEKLAHSVRDKVQEFDKQVVSFESGLEMVAHATDDALEQTKIGLEDCSLKYNETNTALLDKQEEYKVLKSNLEKKIKLDVVCEKLEKMKMEEPEIQALAVEIEKNENANNIRQDYEKLQKTIVDEKELTAKLSVLNENKLKAQSEVQEATNDFDEYQKFYTEKNVELNSKIARLDDLKKFENELNEIKAEKQETEQKLNLARQELAEHQEKLGYIQSDLTKIEENIEKIDEFIELNKPDVDMSYALEQTKGIESELILIDDVYKNVEKLIDQTEADLASVREEYNSAINEEKEIAQKREQIQNSIEVAFEDVDTTNFSKLRSCDKQLEGMNEVKVLVQSLDEHIAKLSLDSENRMATISALSEEIEKEENNLSLTDREINALERELMVIREEREGMLGSNVITLLSDHMKIGDICPVCNSRVIQKVYGEKLDLGSIEGEIEKKNTEIKSKRFDRDKVLASLISLKARYEFEKAQIEINNHEIEKIEGNKNTLYQRYVDNNDDNKENFERLFELIVKTSDSLEELIKLQDLLRDAELRVKLNKAQSGTKVTVYKNYLESLIDILYDLQKKKAEREFAIYNVEQKYENLKEYKKQIAEGKNIELLIDSKKEEKLRLREDQFRVGEDKAVEQKEISRISAAIDVFEEKIFNFDKQINSLTSKITLSGVPEGVSLEEEREETNKIIAQLKFDFDTKQVRLYSCKEHMTRVETEFATNSSILDEKRNDIKSLEVSVSAKMMDANFKSGEDLETFFVETSELKLKQNKVSEFENEKKVLEIQKTELENEINGEVNAEKTAELENEIAQLSAEVKMLSENMGKAGAEFERVKEANIQFNELTQKLAEAKKNYDLAKELSSVLKGKALAEYVAEEFLQEITVSANQKLGLLMDGQYTLKFENKEFVVEDNFNDAEVRPASTLSGGETFLVSLSLALSISDAISMMSDRSMDFFFLDEGFGTLDAELCETVVDALYKLESQNLRIGLISHVAELEESIKNRVHITKDAKGSKIKLEHSL